MHVSARSVFAALAAVSALLSEPANAQTRTASPCVTPTTPCEHWVTFGAGPARSMVYATHALGARNTAMTRAFILIHGASRNADHYFETATAAEFLAGTRRTPFQVGCALYEPLAHITTFQGYPTFPSWSRSVPSFSSSRPMTARSNTRV